jgi:putative heme-binding domain-containing protein
MRQALLALFMSLLFTTPASAQHETGADLFSGAQVWQNLCANCHGLDGGLVPGVDLGHGVFRQNFTDEQLVTIIRNGIPNTTMPPNPTMSEQQAQLVVDYLRSRAISSDNSLAGNATRGRALYEEPGYCYACHMINGEGSPLGPDLSRIGEVRSASELTVELRNPNAVIQPNQRQYEVTTNSGQYVSGRLLNHDIFTVQMLEATGTLRSFNKADLREHGFTGSPMGALREDDWSDQDIADLVAYLASLRAPASGAPTP